MAQQHELNTQISLPLSKAVEISFNSVKIRFGRSLITVSGIVLAIAFLMSIWAGNSIIDGLMGAGDPKINLILQQKGVEIDPDSAAAMQQRSKDAWLVVLSLLVCLVGIANAMLMSVTERFREIGTMKCMGALDGFIIKLFILESTFMGTAGTVIGVIIGFLLTALLNMSSFGTVIFDHLPLAQILEDGVKAIVIGSVLSLVGGILPAYRAAKMEPVDAMSLEV
ncbi:MAG: FtsX-like permease family protein [Gemmatimonadetes bacterium]|nr:FtsX-like permease family protein [Gemmatimonadota bacterium]MXZ09794.1 FtsX-like permease family protein [Gemmatimonadota bacterium]MYB57798.1 FtsX-like permease family protein [Gemmatimonadota bacterium]MYC12537.1 FtsX-like permease family protein [Gemmatimonadota bacterium]MYD60615.1 FtsX-like permease family protein [Gemmatimonadota bacterium]